MKSIFCIILFIPIGIFAQAEKDNKPKNES